jgi:hypothetical protein
MKKIIFAIVFCFAAMASVNAQPRSLTTPSDPRFMSVYNQALELNKNRFADVNKIQIGDTVYFPSQIGSGVEYWIADYPASGVHDCIWNLTGKYLAGQIITVPADTTTNKIEFVAPEPINTNSDLWAWLILIGLMVLVIAFYLLNRFRPWNNRGNINRRPVVNGGLSNNAAEAASQISALTPGSRVVRSERGRLICANPVKVKMNFSDGVKKVALVSGEEYYRITQEDGTVRYARRACGNLVTGSISTLPEGVTFVPSTEENANWTATPATPVTPVIENIVTEPAKKESKESYDFEVLSKVLESAGKMTNVPSKITFGELVIEFQPVPPSIPVSDKK